MYRIRPLGSNPASNPTCHGNNVSSSFGKLMQCWRLFRMKQLRSMFVNIVCSVHVQVQVIEKKHTKESNYEHSY